MKNRAFLLIALGALMPTELSAQQREPDRFTAQPVASVPPSSVQLAARLPDEDHFNEVGFALLGTVGAVTGGFLGYHIDRRFFWSSGGDDPGLTGLVVGALVGFVAGALIGGHLGND